MSNAVFPAKVRGLTWTVNKTISDSTNIQTARSGAETRIANFANPKWEWQLIYDYLWDDPANIASGLTYTDLKTLLGFIGVRKVDFDDFLWDDPNDDNQGPAIVTTGTNWPPAASGTPNTPDTQLQVIADTTNPISAATPVAGGTGFAIGDFLLVSGGGGAGGVVKVGTIGGGGAISSLVIVTGGSGYTTTSGAALTVLTGSGSGSPTANITASTLYYSPIQRKIANQLVEDITDLNQTVHAIAVYANGTLKTIVTDYTIAGPGLAIPGFSSSGLYLVWGATAPAAPVTAQFYWYFRVRFKAGSVDFEGFAKMLSTIGGSENKNGKSSLDLITSRIPLL